MLRDSLRLYHTYLRIYFSKTANTWRLENDDGTEQEYDAAKGLWVPLVSTRS